MGDSKNILGRNDSSYIDKKGHEVNSPYPAHEIVEISGNGGDYYLDKMRALIRNEFSEVAEKHGRETFEEANDFDCGDDDDFFDAPETRYMKEEYFSPPEETQQASPQTPNLGGGEAETQSNQSGDSVSEGTEQ